MEFENTYGDARRAAAFDELDFSGTYYLAVRDLQRILSDHVQGERALDFGCGTGRSSRYLKELGFETQGVDISGEMVALAQRRDPGGDYRVIPDGDFGVLAEGSFDLVFCAFTFDNIPGHDHKVRLFSGLRQLLAEHGRIVNIVSTPEIYTHDWVTFSTSAYPENRAARCGDVVRIVTTEYSDGRPVEDIIWPHEDYLAVYREARLTTLLHERPIATGEEGIAWVSETAVAPWSIYVLGVQPTTPRASDR